MAGLMEKDNGCQGPNGSQASLYSKVLGRFLANKGLYLGHSHVQLYPGTIRDSLYLGCSHIPFKAGALSLQHTQIIHFYPTDAGIVIHMEMGTQLQHNV